MTTIKPARRVLFTRRRIAAVVIAVVAVVILANHVHVYRSHYTGKQNSGNTLDSPSHDQTTDALDSSAPSPLGTMHIRRDFDGSTEYVIFEHPRALERLRALVARSSVSATPTCNHDDKPPRMKGKI